MQLIDRQLGSLPSSNHRNRLRFFAISYPPPPSFKGHTGVIAPDSEHHVMHHQRQSLLTLEVCIVSIGELTALMQNGAPRTVLHQHHAPANLQPWHEAPLRVLGGSVLLVGALDLHLETKAGSMFLVSVPVLGDLPADMILGADLLISGEVNLTIDHNKIHLSFSTPSTASTR